MDVNNTLSCYVGRIIGVLFSTNGVAGQELQLPTWVGLTLRLVLLHRVFDSELSWVAMVFTVVLCLYTIV